MFSIPTWLFMFCSVVLANPFLLWKKKESQACILLFLLGRCFNAFEAQQQLLERAISEALQSLFTNALYKLTFKTYFVFLVIYLSLNIYETVR